MEMLTTDCRGIGWHFYLVFIIITFLGGILYWFVLPETRGIPLEEIAKIFGETEDIMVFSEDLHMDRNTHELVVEEHRNTEGGLTRVVTEAGVKAEEKEHAEQVEHAV